jgi:hypothetical protein
MSQKDFQLSKEREWLYWLNVTSNDYTRAREQEKLKKDMQSAYTEINYIGEY